MSKDRVSVHNLLWGCPTWFLADFFCPTCPTHLSHQSVPRLFPNWVDRTELNGRDGRFIWTAWNKRTRKIEKTQVTPPHNPEVGGSSPPPATIEKPSDCKALRPRSLGFLFAWSGQKRDFSGTVSLICCAVGIKRTAQASTPRPLYTIGLLVLSGAGQNNHDWQRQNKEDNHKAHPLPLWYHYACFL